MSMLNASGEVPDADFQYSTSIPSRQKSHDFSECRRRIMHYHMEAFKKVDIIVTPTTG